VFEGPDAEILDDGWILYFEQGPGRDEKIPE
jgi:hypothetical protein